MHSRWTVPMVCALVWIQPACAATPGARVVEQNGYSGCIELSNGRTRVVLEPNCGGRVLVYSLDGTNALYVDPAQDGWVHEPGKRGVNPCAGRCDIGPEAITPRRPALWIGRWTGEITGPRTARLTSQEDASTGVQLVREFALDGESSHLRFTQVIRNVSDETKRYCHWSRTFAVGDGICLVPLNPKSRYPRGYLLYGPGNVMDYRPEPEPNIRVRDGVLEIMGGPSRPKFAIDASEGWIAYLAKTDQLFLKRFPVYPDRTYGEMAANSVSIWYKDDLVCEIEPIGPWERIEPGQSASFTEDWWLFEYPYPEDRKPDLGRLREFIRTSAPEP